MSSNTDNRFTIGELIQNGTILVHKDGNHGAKYPRVSEFGNEGVPFLTAKLVDDSGNIDLDNVPRLSDKKANTFTFGFIETDDVLLSHNATVGRVAVVPKISERMLIGTSLTHFRLDNSRLLPRYLAAFFTGRDFQNQLAAVMSQTTRNQVPITSQRTLSVIVPELRIQKEIAKILGDLDDKIALNTQVNQTLEAMAQALFKSWFVDFDPVKAKMEARSSGGCDDAVRRTAMAVISGKSDEELVQFEQTNPEAFSQLAATADLFPETLVESELGMIPEGWEEKCIYDTAEYVNGGAFKAADFTADNSGLPIIKIAELKQGISQGTKYTTKKVASKYYIKNDDVLYSWSGSPETSLEVFKWFGGDGILNQHIFKLNFVCDSQKHYAYYLLKELKPLLIATAKQKQTTGLGHITVADMKRIKVAYPESELLDSFSDLICATYERCSSNEKENSRLVQTRDTLLPKLLSGEIDLSSFGDYDD